MQTNIPSPAPQSVPASPIFSGLRTVALSLLVDRALGA
jgi:hypothetical protein